MSHRTQHGGPRAGFRFFGGRSAAGHGQVAVSVAQMVTRPDVTLKRLVAAIERDPVLARRVRHTAEERVRGGKRVRSTRDAVSLMGFAAVGRLAQEHARGARTRRFGRG